MHLHYHPTPKILSALLSLASTKSGAAQSAASSDATCVTRMVTCTWSALECPVSVHEQGLHLGALQQLEQYRHGRYLLIEHMNLIRLVVALNSLPSPCPCCGLSPQPNQSLRISASTAPTSHWPKPPSELASTCSLGTRLT